MILSIVTGTFNRANYLRQMVASARDSIGVGIPYEIVVVDGGSIDDTIPWCRNQSDIKLILQGELHGAVIAFNEGARAASGKYVILANDDIMFEGDGIIHAISYMEQHPDCGIGCFYQDRDNKPWHVEQMPTVTNGKQTMSLYGQVCILPKEVGNHVGWWGDYLHTYGGDNELSANVLELGYTIDAIPCACIHDLKAKDRLREINGGDPRLLHKKGRPHPDTKLWYRKWTQPNGLVGPTIVNDPSKFTRFPRDPYKRFLYMPIYEQGHEIQLTQKRGLRDALARQGLVLEIDYMSAAAKRNRAYVEDYVYDMLSAFKPHMALFQLQDPDIFKSHTIRAFYREFPDTLFVNWNGDYHPDQLLSKEYIKLMKEFDLVGLVTEDIKEEYDHHKINWTYWQIGWEGEQLSDISGVKKHDVVFLGNGYSDMRYKLASMLRSLPYDVGLYGSWPRQFKADGQTLYDFDTGYKIYANAKMAIGDSQWPHARGFVSNRLFQAMYSGVLMLQEWFEGCEDLLGLEHGKHIMYWKSHKELQTMIQYFMSNPEEARTVAKTGQLEVINNHSFDARVRELFDMVFDE